MAHPNAGRKQSPEHIAARVAARRKNNSYNHSEETKARLKESMLEQYENGREKKGSTHFQGKTHYPETIEKMRETRKQMWANGRYEDRKPSTRRATSKMELSLKPYLEKLGYRHNTGEENECFIACEDRTRLPDFIDTTNKKIFEFFGLFWHHPDDEAVWIHSYATKGWECTVLWEDDLREWLEEHKELVTEEEHQYALETSRARHRYPERGNKQVSR